MDRPRLKKPTLTRRHTDGQCLVAYADESSGFLDGLAALCDSLAHGGTIAADTIDIGRLQVTYRVHSPVSVYSDSLGTGLRFSGVLPLEVGAHVASAGEPQPCPPSRPDPPYRSRFSYPLS